MRRDDDRHVIPVIAFNNAAGVLEVHVGTAVLTPDEAMALSADIRRVVAQQARGPSRLLWTLLWACIAGLIADACRGLGCVAAWTGPVQAAFGVAEPTAQRL